MSNPLSLGTIYQIFRRLLYNLSAAHCDPSIPQQQALAYAARSVCKASVYLPAKRASIRVLLESAIDVTLLVVTEGPNLAGIEPPVSELSFEARSTRRSVRL